MLAIVHSAAVSGPETPKGNAAKEAAIDKAAGSLSVKDSPIELARKASALVSHAVVAADTQKEKALLAKQKRLEALLPSLKAAAVGVTRHAAQEAARTAERPELDAYKEVVRQRRSAEKTEAAAHRVAEAAHAKMLDSKHEAIEVLKAERRAALQVAKQNLDATAMLQEKYAALQSAARAEATKESAPTVEATTTSVEAEAAQQVAGIKAQADAAVEQANEAERSLARAKEKLAGASALRQHAEEIEGDKRTFDKAAQGTEPTPDDVVTESLMGVGAGGVQGGTGRAGPSWAALVFTACLAIQLVKWQQHQR